MAFAGMFLGVVFIIIAIVIGFIAFTELVVGIILLIRKKKVPGIILLVLSAIPAVVLIVVIVVTAIQNQFRTFETYDGGTVTVNMTYVERMQDLLRDKDFDGLDALLDEHPELIYFQDNNHTTLLEFGVRSCSVEVMEIAYDHGARFDEETVFENLRMEHSLESFADYEYWCFLYTHSDVFEPWVVPGVTTDEVIEAAKFAVDHGAETVWQKNGITWTFADKVDTWTMEDGEFTDKDRELVSYARSVSWY